MKNHTAELLQQMKDLFSVIDHVTDRPENFNDEETLSELLGTLVTMEELIIKVETPEKIRHEYIEVDLYDVYDAFDANIYDALEVHPCKTFDEDGKTWVEQCDKEESEFHSVYLHMKEGGLECIADCHKEEQAQYMASCLGKAFKLEVRL